MEQMILDIIEFLKQFSYFGVVLALTFEFIPAEVVLPMVGYWVYEGDMNFLASCISWNTWRNDRTVNVICTRLLRWSSSINKIREILLY